MRTIPPEFEARQHECEQIIAGLGLNQSHAKLAGIAARQMSASARKVLEAELGESLESIKTFLLACWMALASAQQSYKDNIEGK